VEGLEKQVEELVKLKDEAQRQSTANAAQWRQIVAMSSQLQARGTEESKLYKSDRESWERDRDGLQRRITDLEAGKLTLVDPSRSTEAGISISPEDILASTSLDVLRAEIVRLRRSCAEMERALRELRSVPAQIDQVMGEFASIRQRITAQTRHGLHEEKEEGVEAEQGEETGSTGGEASSTRPASQNVG